jgi:S-methylmethionine-dependent homocysteine/selenocysteine methylase
MIKKNQLKDGTSLCNGDSFNDAFKKFRDNKQLIAIGINCTSPYHIVSLLESVERVPNDLPFIVNILNY